MFFSKFAVEMYICDYIEKAEFQKEGKAQQTRWRLLILLITLLASVSAAVGQSVISFPGERSATVAVIVRDLTTGNDIVSQNPYKAMLPASTMKCITTAAAMEMGIDTLRFESQAFIRGSIDADGVLHGDLVIRGNGDPTLESTQFPAVPSFLKMIVDSVKAKGIKEIEGIIKVDASNFPDDGPCDRWELSDLRYEYGAGLYSLNYKNNAVGSRAMQDPPDKFVAALDDLLMAEGIAVAWDEVAAAGEPVERICTHHSPVGSEIMHNLMIRSDNLFAEGILRFIAPGKSLDDAIKQERKILSNKGLNLDVTEIYDGSGLARNNRVTAAVMADLLTMMATKQGRDMAYSSLFPRAGEEGTVKSLLEKSPLAGKLALKSGSMNGVHCYAGYKLDEQGKPTHAVVILVNNFHCQRAKVRAAIESFLQKTFQ